MNRLLSLSLALTLVSGSALAQVNWSSVSPTGAPDPYCGFAWDTDRDRLVAFGGALGAAERDETREWNGAGWVNLNPVSGPTGRRRPAMAYDEARGETVLFGGGNGFNNDTWVWNGTSWTQRFPANVPSGRFGAAMAYDRERQVVVMFGGFVPTAVDNNETWEWDGTNWTQRFSAGATPGNRGAHRMVYDDSRQEIILCGGYNTPSQNTLADTWSWNGTTWTQEANLPGTLCDQVLVYDPTRQRVVLQGGLRIAGFTLTDLEATYEWNGTWTPRSPLTSGGSRNSGAAGWDPVNNRVLNAGGTNAAGSIFRDTLMMAPVTPASRTEFGLACALTQGIDLRSQSLPYAGLPFVHEIYNASPQAQIALLIYGGSNTQWNGTPLPVDLNPIGAPACFLNVSFDAPQALLLVNGTASVTWNIPNQAIAIGYTFYTQAFALDPASFLPFQIDMSTARAFTIGSP